jgi:hypothetical protein
MRRTASDAAIADCSGGINGHLAMGENVEMERLKSETAHYFFDMSIHLSLSSSYLDERAKEPYRCTIALPPISSTPTTTWE